ncbi:hypothetical protein IFM89_007265 [Coptis chinensis]|uniref:Transposase Tnp1/En/Spm-like domain-containing protein n=1 Tax=Coptis chinensis TaxID=261450 RepID=A0A835INL3_9MAGN|nr:hypothetical protein IFM89_007265 [Coptis chinensis]
MDPLDEQDGSNSQGAGQEDDSNLQGDGHDRSNFQGADLGDNEISGGTPAVTSSTKRGPSKSPKALPDGKKRKVSTNELGQPNGLDLDTRTFITGLGVNTRKYVPITYQNFRVVPIDFKKKSFECSGEREWIKLGEITGITCISAISKAASKRNKANRSKLRAPNTLGRRSMATTRHVIAVENKFKSDLEVGRAEYHGEKTALVMKKNEELRCENTTTNSKLDRLETELQMVKDMIVASQPASQTQRNPISETPTVEVPLRQPSQMHYSFMNKMRDLHFVGGLKVASGEIVVVNPQSIFHGRPMGEGVFKILLTKVVDSEARVFFPNDFASTLGEVGVHGYVTWPIAFLQVPKDDA